MLPLLVTTLHQSPVVLVKRIKKQGTLEANDVLAFSGLPREGKI